MGFRSHCLELGIKLSDEDIDLIKWRLRQLPARLHKDVLDRYLEIYFEEVAKCDPLNYARHAIARHYARRFIKLYKFKR